MATAATAPPDTIAVSGPAPTSASGSIPPPPTSSSIASASASSSSSSSTAAASSSSTKPTEPLDAASSSTAIVTPQPEAPEAQTSESQSQEPEENLPDPSAYRPGDVNGLLPDVIDSDIFAQLLEMDDDDEEDRDFSKGIVWNYFDQATSTFQNMDQALTAEDLAELSTLGHFLKGSSAAVGVNKVRDSCEAMQHYGKGLDADGIHAIAKKEAIEKLQSTLKAVKIQYKEAEIVLKRFYGDA